MDFFPTQIFSPPPAHRGRGEHRENMRPRLKPPSHIASRTTAPTIPCVLRYGSARLAPTCDRVRWTLQAYGKRGISIAREQS
jgi:hypothetical protein